MRFRLAWVLFVLGVFAAGCGGGGKSGMLPTSNGAVVVSTSTPATSKTTRASISLYVPPANKQASHKPLYISPNTQAFGVFVEPYPSVVPSIGPSSSPPPGLQIFPVATPSPCAVATGGGYTCTLTVTAPVGTDLFIVAAFATASPNASAGPLSAFVSGPVTVSLSPSPGASPLAFTLNGIVDSVAVAVNSPDPGNTPNTQVFTVGVPTGAPIAITAYDSSGNQVMSPATLPYFNPIVIQASPAADGLTLSLVGTSACGSSASGATATINCAGDLGNVQASYDGTPRPDASDHLIDAYAVYSTTAPNPTPSPANFVLAGNIISTQLAPSSDGYVGTASYVQRMNSGQFGYLAYFESPTNGYLIGTFDPSTGIPGVQSTLPENYEIRGIAFAPDGSVWVANSNNKLDCFASIGSASPAISNFVPTETYTQPTDAGMMNVASVTVDTSGNIWYAGYDYSYTGGPSPYNSGPPSFAGFFSSSGCGTPSTTTAQFALVTSGSNYDIEDQPLLAAIPNGSVVAQSNSPYDVPPSKPGNAVYIMNAADTPGQIPEIVTLNANASSAASPAGVAGDSAGNVYSLWQGGPVWWADVEQVASGSSTMNELLALPPTPPATLPSPFPQNPLAFSPNNSGAADRMMMVNDNSQMESLLLIESVSTSPMPIYVSLPTSAYVLNDVYSSKGGEFALDVDGNGNLNMVRILPTKTWSVPNVTLNSACYSQALLTILERGDSGPFTITNLTAGITAAQVPGADHDFIISASGTVSFSATVTDAHGRNEQFSVITSTPNSYTCGVAHRRLSHARIR